MSLETRLTADEIARAEKSANWPRISELLEIMEPTSHASLAERRDAAAEARKLSEAK